MSKIYETFVRQTFLLLEYTAVFLQRLTFVAVISESPKAI